MCLSILNHCNWQVISVIKYNNEINLKMMKDEQNFVLKVIAILGSIASILALIVKYLPARKK